MLTCGPVRLFTVLWAKAMMPASFATKLMERSMLAAFGVDSRSPQTHAPQTMLLRLITLALGALLFASCSSSHCSRADGTDWLAHDVYFELNDSSPEACEEFVEACWSYLSEIDGIRFFASGTRVKELDREVNDQGYDVSLHVFFESKAAHDAYQEDPDHLKLIEDFAGSWRSVRVFDSMVETRSQR